jgi:cephalosporin hydroxylase
MSLRDVFAEAGVSDPSATISQITDVIRDRGNIPTYLDNRMIEIFRGAPLGEGDANMVRHYLRRLSNEGGRYRTWAQREAQLAEFSADSELDFRTMLYSQGAGRAFQWRGRDCFKTIYELALYPMMLAEIRPRSIVELGAGVGGSAAWFADMCSALDLDAVIHAVDLEAKDGAEGAIRTWRRDCIAWVKEAAADRDDFASPVLVIEDFHGDLGQTMQALDDFLRPGDYLVIEDAIPKQMQLAQALQGRPYVIDTHYTDFFGVNCTSAINGILKRV